MIASNDTRLAKKALFLLQYFITEHPAARLSAVNDGVLAVIAPKCTSSDVDMRAFALRILSFMLLNDSAGAAKEKLLSLGMHVVRRVPLPL